MRTPNTGVSAGPASPDGAARVLRVTEIALSALGDPAKVTRWLGEPNRALSRRTPAEVAAASDAGAEEVIEEIRRIEQGIYL